MGIWRFISPETRQEMETCSGPSPLLFLCGRVVLLVSSVGEGA